MSDNNNKGLDYNKLNKFQEDMEAKYSDIKQQLMVQVEEFGEYLKNKTNVKPNPEKFANWFLDEYAHIINKKRRLPFKLDRKYAIRYCVLLNRELEQEHIREKYGVDLIPKGVEEYEHFETILNYLVELFKSDGRIKEEIVFQLTKEASLMLKNQEPIQKFDIIKRSEINTKQENIRFCYYQMYNDILKKPHIRKILINYLLEKFEVFDDTTYTTINSHFKEKPDYYPL